MMKFCFVHLLRYSLFALGGLFPCGALVAFDEARFEVEIRPVLATRCVSCHGPDRKDGAVRLDSKSGVVKAQEEDHFLLTLQGKGSAPASCVLEERWIPAFEAWADAGFPWPEKATVTTAEDRAKSAKLHWAFQPVKEVRAAKGLDPFIQEQLVKQGLKGSPLADKATLLRRLSYAVTGLPPQIIFGKDLEHLIQGEGSFEDAKWVELVDRALASPHYGEQWARHWLDVARYSDTKGYVYGREEKRWPHAWAYRDWVIDAFNQGMPYDRFLQLQLAADLMEERGEHDLAAMGFLTVGRRFLGVKRDIFDDRIDVVTRGMLGLTVGCARCHDHKYDPITAKDYYGLYNVFENSVEKLELLPSTSQTPLSESFQKKSIELEAALEKVKFEASERVRGRLGDYLKAQLELDKYPADGFDQIFQVTDVMPAFVHAWRDKLRFAKEIGDPIFLHWHAFFEVPPNKYSEVKVQGGHPIVEKLFSSSPTSFKDVISRYVEAFKAVDTKWKELVKENPKLTQLPDPHEESLRRILYGAKSPCEVPEGTLTSVEYFLETDAINQLWKLTNELHGLVLNANPRVKSALVLKDRDSLSDVRVFLRGNSLTLGEVAPRQFLEMFRGAQGSEFKTGSGRRELAEAITDPANPLTSRVMVNRVWSHLFGEGLVNTPSDFGTRTDPPSHPELLDWLAVGFVKEGWNLKSLQKKILTSYTWRQSSEGPKYEEDLAKALQKDPSNRWLWKMNSHRLSYEEFQDSMRAASGELDLRMGGPPVSLNGSGSAKRRAIYGAIDRQFVSAELRVFDFANPDLHIPKRNETSVPQQALYFMNHPFMQERAKAVVNALPATAPMDRVIHLFERVLQRKPSEVELAESLSFLLEIGVLPVAKESETAGDWSYGYGAYQEQNRQVENFQLLPHFNGKTWQGGESWPDSKLGWVQLSADGGHPGNHKGHAAIRRWTAPRDMEVEIQSELKHEVAPGDGIRGFIVNSREGLLQSAELHNAKKAMNVSSLKVKQGEFIDFVVDIRNGLSHDQFIWKIDVMEKEGASSGSKTSLWEAIQDFPKDQSSPLNAWEQLAQTILCSNEFHFID